MDGGGAAALRSTIRAQQGGFNIKKYPWAEEYFVIGDQNNVLCMNELPNFLNHDHCVISYEENVCVKEYDKPTNTLVDVQLSITFDDVTLASLHNATNATRYLYAVSNLRWEESVVNGNVTALPCTPGVNPVSRWKPRQDLSANECTNSLTAKSNTALKHALETSNDANPYLRDIYLWNELEENGCDEVDYDSYGMLIMAEEVCFENVYPDYMSVFDFTGYEEEHPTGTTVAYINNWTAIGILEYPDYHPMSYFEELKEAWGMIKAVERYSHASTHRVKQGARYGDRIILDQFADQMSLNSDPGSSIFSQFVFLHYAEYSDNALPLNFYSSHSQVSCRQCWNDNTCQ